MPRRRRRLVQVMAVLAMAFVACEGPFCNADGGTGGRPEEQDYKTSEQVLATPTATATLAPATATSSATPTPTGTTTSGGAAAGQAVRLRGALGVDHPPFATDYKVGGNSVGLACISGIPANGIVRITIGGGTGAPPTVIGTGGADGTVIIPFPIQQFGAMNGSITSLMVNAQPTPFIADPFTYTVGSGEQICAPPR